MAPLRGCGRRRMPPARKRRSDRPNTTSGRHSNSLPVTRSTASMSCSLGTGSPPPPSSQPDQTVRFPRRLPLIALLVYTFARVSAAIDMNVEDYYVQGRRSGRRLHDRQTGSQMRETAEVRLAHGNPASSILEGRVHRRFDRERALSRSNFLATTPRREENRT